ncbi:MAG: glucuronate isomerase [Bacteroidales bacterium]|nr:glucuronate isomerase [Bacteroidales bacterium]
MKQFMDEDFLLRSKTAQRLYHEYAENMPIIDYHCHLLPYEIAENKRFENITQLWLYGDHYKWRAMRSNGVDEKYCSGDADDFEKFMKWAETVPRTIRNPLYHWTHLELKRYFGIDELLNKDTAKNIYERTREQITSNDFSAQSLLRKMNVEIVCTTDDPVDSLENHAKLSQLDQGFRMLPAWRPDKAMNASDTEAFNNYVSHLSEVVGRDIADFQSYLDALKERHDFFGKMGSRLSDHGLENFYAESYTTQEINSIFTKIRSGQKLTEEEVNKFKSGMLYELAVLDNSKNWVQQFHIGAFRNVNSKRFEEDGPDIGYDSIGDFSVAKPMAAFLDRLSKNNALTKTILYNLNPRDNAVFATMLGNFQDGKVPGKIQFGAAWWFLDQRDGITDQLNTLSNLGLLSRFVGMLTDSRSLLSFPRHEYFRRILCDLIGQDVEDGLVPNDMNLLGNMVKDICYYNAKEYFNF